MASFFRVATKTINVLDSVRSSLEKKSRDVPPMNVIFITWYDDPVTRRFVLFFILLDGILELRHFFVYLVLMMIVCCLGYYVSCGFLLHHT